MTKPKGLPTLWSRRDLLTRSGWLMVLGSWGVAVVGTARMLFPRVAFTPRQTVVLGAPADFSVGEVSDRWKEQHRFIVVREQDGFYALKSVCTHLGCIPMWKPAQKKFKCPCHGSGFHVTGVNFEGPAPRPLERLKIFLDEDGQLVVDKSVSFRKERGQWGERFAFLHYPGDRNGRS